MASIVRQWIHFLCPVCFMAFKEQDRPPLTARASAHLKGTCPRCGALMQETDHLKTTTDAV